MASLLDHFSVRNFYLTDILELLNLRLCLTLLGVPHRFLSVRTPSKSRVTSVL